METLFAPPERDDQEEVSRAEVLDRGVLRCRRVRGVAQKGGSARREIVGQLIGSMGGAPPYKPRGAEIGCRRWTRRVRAGGSRRVPSRRRK